MQKVQGYIMLLVLWYVFTKVGHFQRLSDKIRLDMNQIGLEIEKNSNNFYSVP